MNNQEETLLRGLEIFKVKYRPRQGYNILLFITTDNHYFAAVFEQQQIKTRKEELVIAELSRLNVRASNLSILISMLDKYIVNL